MSEDRYTKSGLKTGTPQCASMFNRWRCLNTGRHEHKGQLFCLIHHPPTVSAKADKRHEERVEKSKERERHSRSRLDAEERQRKRAGCFDVMLDALLSIDKRLKECAAIPGGVSAGEAYDSFYQEIVEEAITKAQKAAEA